MWQLCITGLDGKTIIVKIKSNEPEQTTVKRLKELVHEETGLSPDNQRLLYGAKQLEDTKRLCDYPPLGNNATIMLVARLPGGGGLLSRTRDDDYSRHAPIYTPRTNDDATVKSTKTVQVDVSIRNEHESIIHSSEDEDIVISGSIESSLYSESLPSSPRSTSPDHSVVTRENSFTPQTNDDVTQSTRNVDKSIPRSSEDCMITLTPDNSLLTPCGHPISPDGLMDYCWNEIASIKHEIKCPLCSTEWSLEMIKRYGGASDTEMTQLEQGIACNACKNDPTIQQCPFCGVYCERQNTLANSVTCIVCAMKPGGGNKVFCWLCLKPWKTNFMAENCGNEECNVNKRKLQHLKESPMAGVDFFPGKKIYKLRACPECGILIEHKGGCKQMRCTNCNAQFCFICLRKRFGGSWSCGSYNTSCELAPIQDTIPTK